MARAILSLCLLLFCFGSHQQNQASANLILLPFEALDFVLNAKENIEKVVGMVTEEKPAIDQIKPEDVQMLNMLDRVANKIDSLKEDVSSYIKNYSADRELDSTTKLFTSIRKIKRHYRNFMRRMRNADKYNPLTIKETVDTTVSFSLQELPALVEEMHSSFTDPTDVSGKTVLSKLAKSNGVNLMCDSNRSLQQIINEIYKMIVYTDVKSVVVRLYSYTYKERLEKCKSCYKREKRELMNQFKSRAHNIHVNVKTAMSEASRDIWRCDPAFHQKEVTYSKMQDIFQQTLMFERDIEPHCSKDCSKYVETTNSCESKFCSKETKEMNKKKTCKNGKIRNCQTTSSVIDYCYSAPNSSRRYEWLTTEAGITFGRGTPSSCQNNKGHNKFEWGIPTAEYYYIDGLYHCDFCLCTCDDHDENLDRYFSLREVTSDKKNNKVITGVSFENKNHIFYIKIQEGILAANGTVNSAEWREVKEFETDKIDMLHNKNLFAVTWDNKTVYLDDIEDKKSSNKVLTGLSFRDVGGKLRLDAELTEYDYKTGRLGDSSWFFNDVTNRTPVSLEGANDPTLFKNDHIMSMPGQSIEFQTTDTKKDLGQSTIPYIDLQKVVSKPPVPLAGIGLVHKAAEGSGGFLALKIKQFDLSSLIPDVTEKIHKKRKNKKTQ